jgi:hypothetical protein
VDLHADGVTGEERLMARGRRDLARHGGRFDLGGGRRLRDRRDRRDGGEPGQEQAYGADGALHHFPPIVVDAGECTPGR